MLKFYTSKFVPEPGHCGMVTVTDVADPARGGDLLKISTGLMPTAWANGGQFSFVRNPSEPEDWPTVVRNLSAQLNASGIPNIHDDESIWTAAAATANKPEPPPTKGGTDVWPLVIADMRERNAIGTAKYGTPLQTGNGRDAQVDLYQELLDATVYCRQRIEEEKGIVRLAVPDEIPNGWGAIPPGPGPFTFGLYLLADPGCWASWGDGEVDGLLDLDAPNALAALAWVMKHGPKQG